MSNEKALRWVADVARRISDLAIYDSGTRRYIIDTELRTELSWALSALHESELIAAVKRRSAAARAAEAETVEAALQAMDPDEAEALGAALRALKG